MHEMGIADSILKAIHQELHLYPRHRAVRVGVRIGEMAAVDPASLQFCFEALVKGTDLEPLELEIEWRRAEAGKPGDELDLAYLELDDALERAGVESGNA
jgi:hydrogenase nickel incorporation protein HypA/HybF